MENCPICGSELKTVPAGISKKTGKPYRAFIACTKWECKYTNKIAPQATGSPTRPQYSQPAPLPLPRQEDPRIAELEAKVNALTQELNTAKFAIHGLWATLILGDKAKETMYEYNKIQIIKPQSPVEPEPEQLNVPY